MNTKPRLISLEDFLKECNATWEALSEPAYHRNPGGLTKVEARRRKKEFFEKSEEIERLKEESTKRYYELVDKGEIRPPTPIEVLIRIANGHDDNPSVQAARRVCIKRKIDWKIQTMEEK